MSSQPIPGTSQDPGGRPVGHPAEPSQGPDEAASATTGGDPARGLEALQGTWRSIAMVVDGRRIPAAALEHRRIIVIDDKYVVVDRGRTLRRGAFRVDPTATPMQIDALPAEGPNVGKVDRGIYALAADTLQLCWAPPGRPRPTNFMPEPGSKQWMAIDQKEDPAAMAEQGRVIAVSRESPVCPGMYTSRVHHSDLPQLHGEGETPYEAALVLLRHPISETGTIATGWQRAGHEQVITDVREFLDRVS